MEIKEILSESIYYFLILLKIIFTFVCVLILYIGSAILGSKIGEKISRFLEKRKK